MGQIVVVGELLDGALSDGTFELLTRARDIASAAGHTVTVVTFGDNARDAVREVDADDAVIVSGPAVADYQPETYENAVLQIVGEDTALVMLGNTTMGMDLGAAVAARKNRPMVAYCTDLTMDGAVLVATSQVYGGKLNAEVEVPLTGAVVTVIPGSWPVDSSRAGSPAIREEAAPSPANLELTRVIEAESGQDVDITKADILVSVGRGIEDPDNLELADALAEVLGGVVSCSRPVVDAGWLPRSRQVGKSGKTVKPKVYLALGISGAPEHLQGMKDAELIIAVNNDERAPIFDVAHYGATADILDLMPALTEKLEGRAG
ncbi:electron transfer flavoprotein subunit alpha/FixB family protein [Sulfobacillus harzensis]|uniref:Electron transfer flavoprotein subunit alpha/FixB family protein n=1 Tax=Sulfobacillus harzensis TaxID=2729629 RepID=A0A7Y0Q2G8_9FIRM|nr:electron transfer flavoprotein subunit alpha/FixB family protein [Sulfobacillus harzensis]NMP21901.1 electron transfer flavoprotein subunit alpha/FixB family protein [Sulfobacillus harzensis]